jgi:DNA polymerase-3 subunit delta'
MQFKDIIGQSSVKQRLRRMADGGRMPHAMLLLGPSGSGKLALAVAMAQYVLCQNPSEEDACGQCNSCIKASKLVHPDLHFSYPTVGTNATSENFLPQWRMALLDNPYLNANDWLQHIAAENRQGNITKDECVNIIRKLNLKTFESTHKVLVMWLPEYLAKEGNRLLKLIEEPPERTLFLLVAENQELILNTILSRCQIVNVRALEDEDVCNGLLQRGIPEEQARSIAYMSNGSYREALLLADKRENDNAQRFLQWMRNGYQGKPINMVKWSEDFAQLGRESQKHFLTYALHFLRELTLLKAVGPDARVRLQGKELESAKKMAAVLELEQAEQLSQLFSDCAFAVERNANPKVLFLDASIKMHSILKNKLPEPYRGMDAKFI